MVDKHGKDAHLHYHFTKCRSQQQEYTILIREVQLLKFNDIGIRIWRNRHCHAQCLYVNQCNLFNWEFRNNHRDVKCAHFDLVPYWDGYISHKKATMCGCIKGFIAA